MDDKSIEGVLHKISEINHSLDKEIADIRYTLAALVAIAATELEPDDPAKGVQHIRALEDAARKADPTLEVRQRIGEVLEAVKLLRKHGGSRA